MEGWLQINYFQVRIIWLETYPPVKSETQFGLCTVLKHSRTHSMALSLWHYLFLPYIVTFLPLLFYQESRKIVMGVLACYLRRYHWTNPFPSWTPLPSSASIVAASMNFPSFTYSPVTTKLPTCFLICHSLQKLQHESAFSSVIFHWSFWFSPSSLYLYVELFTSSLKASFGSAIAGVCQTLNHHCCALFLSICSC